jgi:hypothetical protein
MPPSANGSELYWHRVPKRGHSGQLGGRSLLEGPHGSPQSVGAIRRPSLLEGCVKAPRRLAGESLGDGRYLPLRRPSRAC